ncbi:stress response protein nst1-like [Vicia villosa]|uniref:stress response protein nst1-like n=1 Tax=Vicia villosa TaxID=3911 RepID=UPI00273C13E1|nr:stress response protein nst1-like [Vicia villosa]XP_058753096.1 stress response protein nst1-like [Vicia villosa]
MCILCVIQKCSRRVATMLPWLVIPLIGLWALSQLLPPAFRFEITSPRLACVFVLLVTLFWYEILMPQLSAWRVRRNARIRERKRFEAIELQKLRKTATRRCRNCLNPYRDQNPGGSRFMCSFCGHVSKRPVLDLPDLQELGISNSGVVKDLVGKHGKMLSKKVWSENGWMCSQDWLENGNWVGGSVLGNPINWRMNGNGSIYGGDEHCLTARSYSGILVFVCRLLASFFLTIRWLWRKIFRIGSREDRLSDAERRALLAKRGENGENLNESRGERARRKAEEKRQARIEKELLEEEERKQREEVAKLVEERRRLRDETVEAEKDSSQLSHTSKEKDRKKEAEKKRQERRKEKDRGSSKSNSDVEEMEKRATRESERKRDFEKKSGTDHREHQKSGLESDKGQNTDTVHSKVFVSNNYNRGSTGTRYFDRMRGTILSSSKALGFGKGASIPATVVKESKSNNSVDHAHTSASRRDIFPPGPTTKSNLKGDDKIINHSVIPEPQPWTAPKKSWQQLFTRSSSVPKSSNSNVICRPNSKIQVEVEAKSPQLSGQSPVAQSFNNPIQFGLPSPFDISNHLNGSTSSSLGFSPAIEPVFSPVVNTSHDFRHEEQELFEDPCYDPVPLSLLGPVSESLENFQLDLGSGSMKDKEVIKPRSLRNTSGTDLNKPSPIESPLTREKKNGSNRFTGTPQSKDIHPFPLDDAAAIEKGTWQMWTSSPLVQEGLGFVGGPESWLLSSQRNVPTNGDFMLPACQKTMPSVFNRDDNIVSSGYPAQNVFLPNGNNSGGTFSPVAVSSGYDPWLQNGLFPPLSGNLKTHESAKNETIYGSPSGTAISNVLECSPANCWSKNEWHAHGSVESIGKSSAARAHIGSPPYPTSDVHSFWSFD